MSTRPTRPTHSPTRRAGGRAHTRPAPFIKGAGGRVCVCPRATAAKAGRVSLLADWPPPELTLPTLEELLAIDGSKGDEGTDTR